MLCTVCKRTVEYNFEKSEAYVYTYSAELYTASIRASRDFHWLILDITLRSIGWSIHHCIDFTFTSSAPLANFLQTSGWRICMKIQSISRWVFKRQSEYWVTIGQLSQFSWARKSGKYAQFQIQISYQNVNPPPTPRITNRVSSTVFLTSNSRRQIPDRVSVTADAGFLAKFSWQQASNSWQGFRNSNAEFLIGFS